MRRFRKPRCPYCGSRLNYAQAWVLRRRGEYICPKCGGLSNVVLDPGIYGFAFLAFLFSLGFFIPGMFLGGSSFLWAIPGTFFPFFLFFLFSVFCVRLRKPAPRRPRVKKES